MKRSWGLMGMITLLLLLSACHGRPATLSENDQENYRVRAATYLAQAYPALDCTLDAVTLDDQNIPLVDGKTVLLGQNCHFQLRLGREVVSDDLPARAIDLFAVTIWRQIYDRYEDGSPRIVAVTDISPVQLKLAMETEFMSLEVKLPFTLTLSAAGSQDDLKEQIALQAEDLAARHLAKAYSTEFACQITGKAVTGSRHCAVPAQMTFLGDRVDFTIQVGTSSVGDDMLRELTDRSYYCRSAAWAYDEQQNCPGKQPLQTDRPLSFIGLRSGWAYVSDGEHDAGWLPWWYLTRETSEVIPPHAATYVTSKEKAALLVAPVTGQPTVGTVQPGRLLQVTAAFNDYRYVRYQADWDQVAMAGWISSASLLPAEDSNQTDSMLASLDRAALPFLNERYAPFQPAIQGPAYQDGPLARIKSRLTVLGQSVHFAITYDGLYHDDLAEQLAGLSVYARLPLAGLGNADRAGAELVPAGRPLRLLALSSGERVGAWVGADLPWALLQTGKTQAWLPIWYLSTTADQLIPTVKPIEMIAATATTVELLPDQIGRFGVCALTPGQVVRIVAVLGDLSFVEYFVGEAVPWVGGWVQSKALQAFDPPLSKEGRLAKGAIIHELGPGDKRSAYTTSDEVHICLLGEEQAGWIKVAAPGGMCGWTDVKNVISRNPWR